MAQETQYFDFSGAADPFDSAESDALAVLMPSRGGQLRIDIHKELVTIGRTDAADVVIAHKNVSKNHAELSKESGSWTVRDTASTNGVFVNGERISDTTPLNNGDRVSFGDQEYTFTLTGGTGASPAPAAAADAAPAAAAAAPAATDTAPAPDDADSADAGGDGGDGGGAGMTGMFADLFGGGGPPAASPPPAAAPSAPAPSAAPSGGGETMQSKSAPQQPAAGATMMASFDLSMAVQTETYARLVEKSLNPRDLDLQNVRNRFGSAPTNDLVINEPSVKPEHGEFIFEEDGRIRMRTLTPEIVVRVNGEPVRNAFVKHLDTLQIGDCVYTFQLFKVPDPSEFKAADAPKNSGGMGKILMIGLVLVLLATAAGVFLLPMIVGTPTEDEGTQNGQIATPTVAPQKSLFEATESLFLKQKYAEASTSLQDLDPQDPEVMALTQAIRMTVSATDAMRSKNYLQAIADLEKLDGSPYQNSPPVERLRDSLAFERSAKAREAFDYGTREYDAGRFTKAREQFQQALIFDPDMEDAASNAEAARLASIVQKAIEDATELSREGAEYSAEADLFERAANTAKEAIDAIEATDNIMAVERVQKEFGALLNDLYNYNMMRDIYLKGDGERAVTFYARLSESFVADNGVDRMAERMQRVTRLVSEAAAEQSLKKAIEALDLETDSRTAYHKAMKVLKAELSEVAREQARRWFDLAQQQYSDGEKFKALESLYKARQIDPEFIEAESRHGHIAGELLTEAYRMGDSRPEDRVTKIEAYQKILSVCFPEDSEYRQAEQQIARLSR